MNRLAYLIDFFLMAMLLGAFGTGLAVFLAFHLLYGISFTYFIYMFFMSIAFSIIGLVIGGIIGAANGLALGVISVFCFTAPQHQERMYRFSLGLFSLILTPAIATPIWINPLRTYSSTGNFVSEFLAILVIGSTLGSLLTSQYLASRYIKFKTNKVKIGESA